MLVEADSSTTTQRHAVTWLFVTLSFTGLTLFRVGDQPLTAFLFAFAFAFPTMWFGLGRKLQLFDAPALVSVIVLSAAINAPITSWVSVAYSMIFIATYVTLMNGRRLIPKDAFGYLLKAILIAYFANVVIAQLLVVLGMPNEFLGELFPRYVDDQRAELGLRYYGFSNEPSYAAFVVVSSFLALLKLPRGLLGNERLVYGGLVVYQVVAFGSVFGYLLSLAVAGGVAYRAMPRTRFIALLAIAFSVGAMVDYTGEGRFGRIVNAVVNFELDSVESLSNVDSSLFMRGAPVIEFFFSLELSDIHTYVGHGPKANEAEYTEVFAAWTNSEDIVFQTSFLPAFAYDFGILGAGIVLFILARLMSERRISLEILFLIALLFNANFNTQLFWFVVLVFAMTKECRAEVGT